MIPGGPEPVRVLMIDDDDEDFELTRDALRDVAGNSYVLDWASTYGEGLRALSAGEYDAYLLDYHLGPDSGLDLLREAAAESGDRAIIFLTGVGDRDVDVAAMEAGATDYLVKARVDGEVLERTIRYAIERARLIRRLRETLEEVRTLRKLLPICMWCKKVHTEDDGWEDVDLYLHRRAATEVSHGVCPDCLGKHYGEFAQ